MTTYYAAQAARGANNGSSPANAWAIGSVNWSTLNGHTIYLVGTITSRVNVNASGSSNVSRITIRGDYPQELGTIDRGFDSIVDSALTMTNQSFITIKGLEVCNSYRIGIYRGETAGDGSTDASIIIEDCYIHDIYGSASNDSNAVQGWGRNSIVRRCRIDDVGTDCIWWRSTDGFTAHDIDMTHGAHAGIGNNDCIQLECPNAVMWNLYMDCSAMTTAKPQQALVLVGDNIEVTDFVIIGSPLHVSSSGIVALGGGAGDATNVKLRRGRIYNDAMGVFFNGASGGLVESMLLVGIGAGAQRGGITGGSGNVVTARHCTVVGYGGQTGITLTGAGSAAQNNCVTECAVGVSVSGNNYSYNNCFGNGTNFGGGAQTGDVTVEPDHLADYMPKAAGIRTSGTYIAGTDLYGMAWANPPTMGAVQYQAAVAGAALPAFLFDSRLNDATPAASTTDEGYDVLNIRDLRPYSFWRPTALPATITVDCGEAAAADFAAIYRHDLASKHCTIEVRASSDNFSASDVLLIRRPPLNDDPIVLPFASADYRYWRITITGVQIPTLAIALIGEAFRLPRRLTLGLDPVGRAARTMTNQSSGGYPLGKVTAFEEWRQKLQLDVVQWEWLRESWLPAWREWLRDEPFLFAWDSTDHPTEVYLVHAEGQFAAPTIGGDKCSFELELGGKVD